MIALDVRNEVLVFSYPPNALNPQLRQKLGPEWPQRRIRKFAVHWGEAATKEQAMELFSRTDDELKWRCRKCQARVSQLLDQCTECQTGRVDDDASKTKKVAKVAVAMPKSKEAQDVRKKMHARLRSQYQKQLDALEENFAKAL